MNPLPGMNPYLERYWRDVHASLIVYAREALQQQLPHGLVARIEERVYVDVPQEGSRRVVYPDVKVSALRTAPSGTATAVAPHDTSERIIIDIPEEPITETYIEIVDVAGGKVITVIEVLSVANKLPGEGRVAYLRKQREAIEARVSLVEIDLLRTGERTLSIRTEDIPIEFRTPYIVCVFRSWQPGKREIYPIALNQRLPEVLIPLRPSDPDARLNLQDLLNRCYDIGRYDELIDYSCDPEPSLDAEATAWLNAVLVEKGLRAVS